MLRNSSKKKKKKRVVVGGVAHSQGGRKENISLALPKLAKTFVLLRELYLPPAKSPQLKCPVQGFQETTVKCLREVVQTLHPTHVPSLARVC